MTFSFRKLAAALVAVAALSVGGANTAQAGILLVLQDSFGNTVATQYSAGNVLNYAATDLAGGYTNIIGQVTTNAPGTPGVGPNNAGIGTLNNSLNVTTATTGPVAALRATAFVVNSNNPNDLTTFLTPTGNVFLNNDLTANGGASATSGIATLGSTAISVGVNQPATTLTTTTPIPGASEAFGFTPFFAPNGYNLYNYTQVVGLNNGAVQAQITGKTTVAGGVVAPEPGTLAAALTGLVFVGGGLLRRRTK